MRHILGIAVAAALLFTAPRTADAALVVGFGLGEAASTQTFGGVTITKYPVMRTNGLADSSAAPMVSRFDSSTGDVFTSFSGTFSANEPLDLLSFAFNGQAVENRTAEWSATVTANGFSLTESGSFSGTGQYTKSFSFPFIQSGSISIELEDGYFINDGASPLLSDFETGFAAISGQPTAIPEPSTVAGLALLSGLGLVIHRRRRVAKLG